jgi:hypothetical protein
MRRRLEKIVAEVNSIGRLEGNAGGIESAWRGTKRKRGANILRRSDDCDAFYVG